MAEKVLMKGNEALAEAAIQCGCRHYFGYPITPHLHREFHLSQKVYPTSVVLIFPHLL